MIRVGLVVSAQSWSEARPTECSPHALSIAARRGLVGLAFHSVDIFSAMEQGPPAGICHHYLCVLSYLLC